MSKPLSYYQSRLEWYKGHDTPNLPLDDAIRDIESLLARVEAAENIYPVINAFMALSGVVDGLLTTHFNLSGMETYGEALKRLNALQEAYYQRVAALEATDGE